MFNQSLPYIICYGTVSSYFMTQKSITNAVLFGYYYHPGYSFTLLYFVGHFVISSQFIKLCLSTKNRAIRILGL